MAILWSELSNLVPSRFSQIDIDVQKQTDYFISYKTGYAEISDVNGNYLTKGNKGSFNSGDYSKITINVSSIEDPMLNLGDYQATFEKQLPSSDRSFVGLQINVPSDAINATGLTRSQLGEITNLVTAAGINANVLFEGTFGFSSDYSTSQTDPNGFADDALTTGGTLGSTYDPSNDITLPL